MSSLRRSTVLAALLSFIFPGLGQAYLGAWRRALIFALPIAIIAIAGGWIFLSSPWAAVGIELQPEVLAGLLGANVLLFLWRCTAVVDAYRLAVGPGRAESSPGPGRRRAHRAVALGVLTTLFLVMAASHAVVGYAGYEEYETVAAIFDQGAAADEGTAPGEDPYGTPVPDTALDVSNPMPNPELTSAPTSSPTPSGTATGTTAPSSAPNGPIPGSVPAAPTPWAAGSAIAGVLPSLTPSPAATPVPSPSPTPRPDWASDGRLDVLIIGGDAGPDRWSLRTDTMILVSVDVKTGRAAMFGIPRNLYNVPLPPRLAGLFPNGVYPRMINDLYSYADQRPNQFPGGKARGYLAIGGAIEALTGVDLDGIAVADLQGFVRLIDALGGLNITIRQSLYDANYPLEDGSGWIEVYFKPGKYRLDGRMALAYARSRHQDSDYGRMHRQQEVLMALRNQLKPMCLIPKVSQLAKIAKSSLWTNIPVSALPGLLELASRVDTRTIKQVFFNPPTYREYLQQDDILRIRKVVRDAFKGPPPKPDPAIPAPADDSSC